MIRAFVEAPAGLAAVSLRLHGGQHCRPPISRMGNKAGYSAVILAALGLRSGEGAGAYVWAESDPDVRALLRAYPDADMLRRIADIIRGWKDEEPRALWERLRAERKARGPAVESDVAGWLTVAAGSLGGVWGHGPTKFEEWGHNPSTGERFPGNPAVGLPDACHRLAEYATGCAEPAAWAWLQSRSVGGVPVSEGLPFYGPTMPAGDPKNALLGRRVATCDGVASGFERVAGWMYVNANSWKGEGDHWKDPNDDVIAQGITVCRSAGGLAGDLERAPSRWPPVAVLATIPDAATLSAMLGTPGDLEGVVCYMDPPYVGTTGYADDLPRADVVRLALDYHRAGAVVCVSEAVPVEELVAVGWHTTDIAAGRKGQRRTFARVATEALTMNIEPRHRVATQVSMFSVVA